MTSKEEEVSAVYGSIFPRRLRSGTPLGEHRFLSSKSAETMSEKSTIPHSKKDVDAKACKCTSECKACCHQKSLEVREKVNDIENCNVGSKLRSPAPRPQKTTKTTPGRDNQSKENEKCSVADGGTLSKRRTLTRTTVRDLLKKSSKDNSLQHEKGNSDHTPQDFRHRSVSFFESSNSVKENAKKRSHKILETSLKPSPTKPMCSPAVDVEAANTHHQEIIDKESTTRRPSTCKSLEMPDDYWVMRKLYLQKDRQTPTSLNAKTTKMSDSCSQGSLRLPSKRSTQKNVKVDVLQEVRVRSSPHVGRQANTGPQRVDKQQNQDSVSPGSSSDGMNPGTKTSCSKGTRSSREQTHGQRYNGSYELPDLQFSGHNVPDQTTTEKMNLAGHEPSHPRDEPVLEESTLPPVANTVELLTEPRSCHDHEQNEDSEDDDNNSKGRLIDSPSCYCQESGGCEVEKEQDSPGPPLLEPIIVFKRDPESELEEPGSLDIGQQPVDEEGCVSQNLHRKNEERELVGENGKKGFSKPRSGVANGDRAAERICEVGSFTADYVDGKRDCAETGTCSRQDDNGSRRRRKGRPSRRAKTDPRWLSEASLSPREDEGQRTGNVYRDKASLQLLASRDRPSKDQTARKSTGKRQGEASGGSGRRNRKVVDLESLWANPELDTHAFLLWASENRHGMQKRHPDASSGEVEHLLASEWTEVTFSGKVHFLCRARDAGTDQDKHAFRKKKAPFEKKNASDPEGNSVYEQFLILPLERQRELLRKWMKFFQKMLPRLEYQEFINDFKKACKSLQLRPVSARRKNARLRNLDPTHYKMLFEKIREARPRVISIYNKRKAREDTVLWQSFHALVRRLVLGQSWPFLRGCRSKVLGELLKDIQQLEVEEALAQIDPPFSLTASEVHDVLGQTPTGPSTPSPAASAPLSGGNDLFDDVRMLPTSGPETEGSSMVPREATPVSGAGHYSPVRSFIQAPGSSREPSGPAGDAELPDNAFVLGLLDGLQHAADLPVLDQRSLDTVFLGPPPRVRMTVHTRDTQLQHSAAYRRTLLYKHIQPLVDTHSLSHALPSLYHGHPPRFFFQEDR